MKILQAIWKAAGQLNQEEGGFGRFLFSSRWLLVPLHLGLVPVLVLYIIKFFKELWGLYAGLSEFSDTELLLGVLHLLDIVMVGHLIVMVMIGGFALYIRRLHPIPDQARLQWLDHIDATALKVKLGMALIGISSIHLLEAFVNANNVDWEHMGKLLAVHMVFVVSTIAIAWIGRYCHVVEAARPQGATAGAGPHRAGKNR